MTHINGIGNIELADFTEKESTGGIFFSGRDGVKRILATKDKKVDFVEYGDKCIAYVHSSLGYPAMYEMTEPTFRPRAKAVLMDLDGTSVHSEEFWVWIIGRTVSKLMGNPKFELEEADLPFVSGHSVSEHLQYCIDKYCPEKSVEEARSIYYEVTDFEMNEIMEGRGRKNAFTPTPGLKDFLLELKGNGVKLGLVTSGLYQKAWPEILSAFRTLDMGDPAMFYDAIITAGTAIRKGQPGTLGELSPKPHPWLYAETARVGLGIPQSERASVVGMEDSGAGVLSVRLAGFACIGLAGGNIEGSGVSSLCQRNSPDLEDALKYILGK